MNLPSQQSDNEDDTEDSLAHTRVRINKSNIDKNKLDNTTTPISSPRTQEKEEPKQRLKKEPKQQLKKEPKQQLKKKSVQQLKEERKQQLKEERKQELPQPVAIPENLMKQYGSETWFPTVRELLSNRSWQEAVCMQSGYGELLIKHFGAAVEQFIIHVRAYDKVNDLAHAGNTKYYFSSFTKPGTPTGKRLREHLDSLEKALRGKNDSSNPYRYESRVDGLRMADGQIISEDAPPRPSPEHYWNEAQEAWRVKVY